MYMEDYIREFDSILSTRGGKTLVRKLITKGVNKIILLTLFLFKNNNDKSDRRR